MDEAVPGAEGPESQWVWNPGRPVPIHGGDAAAAEKPPKAEREGKRGPFLFPFCPLSPAGCLPLTCAQPEAS